MNEIPFSYCIFSIQLPLLNGMKWNDFISKNLSTFTGCVIIKFKLALNYLSFFFSPLFVAFCWCVLYIHCFYRNENNFQCRFIRQFFPIRRAVQWKYNFSVHMYCGSCWTRSIKTTKLLFQIEWLLDFDSVKWQQWKIGVSSTGLYMASYYNKWAIPLFCMYDISSVIVQSQNCVCDSVGVIGSFK